MRKVLAILGILMVAGLAALGFSFTEKPLTTGELPGLAVPSAHPPQTMRLSAMLAGKMFAPAAFAYRGGDFTDERIFSMGAILIEHPKGSLLFDTGFGRDVEEHLHTIPWIAQKTTRIEKEETAAAQLKHAGFAPENLLGVVLTHAHWDHVSGLEEMPTTPVWVTQQEMDFVTGGDAMTTLARQLGTRSYQVYSFSSGPYLGFPGSHDVFGDGSVVLVPAPGHTPGSIIAFIATPDKKRYALIGDLVWQIEGINLPAERPWLSRKLVDHDDAEVRQQVLRMHHIKALMPNLIVVPAHDRRIWESLPKLSAPLGDGAKQR